MSERKKLSCLLLVSLMMLSTHCDSQASTEEDKKPPDGSGGDGGAFFALRSCHQLLRGDAGAFFSPDYLCSNPPLWCNWTLQVAPGQRIHLHLEDLTPDHACHLKQDQVHVDEPAGPFGGHGVLQKCWREAKYTSRSNTLYVVLLIGGRPSPPYRGFYGRYQAFGPPAVYNPQEGPSETDGESSPGLLDLSDPVLDEQVESEARSGLMFDYYDQTAAVTEEEEELPEEELPEEELPKEELPEEELPEEELPEEELPEEELPEEERPKEEEEVEEVEDSEELNLTPAGPTDPASTQGTSRSGRGAAQTPSARSDPSDPSDPPEAPQQNQKGQNQDGQNQEEEKEEEEEEAAVPSEGPEPPEPEPEPTHPRPNMVEPLSDHRGNLNIKNHSETPHLPGDHLFEVSVEVNFSPDVDASWDERARSLLLSLKTLISERLEALQTPKSTTSKRIKRLSAGALFILWLQIGRGPGGLQVHRVVHSALQGLITAGVGSRGHRGGAVISSVSTADVNECGTQLVLCDVNADCVDEFGSYSCRCQPGFQDTSRLGSGGTSCAAVKAAGCSSGVSAETKGVYVLFFLLGSVVLVLLAAGGLLYHRHQRGAFLVRCHSGSSLSPSDPNNNNNNRHRDDSFSGPVDSDLPPPPPARGFREGWAQVKERCPPVVDLPLLRFSPLLPPDAYKEPQEKK